MNNRNVDEELQRFREHLKEYYDDEGNKKIFSQLSTKDRLGLSELGLIFMTKRVVKLEMWRKIHEMVMIVLGLAVLILTFMKG